MIICTIFFMNLKLIYPTNVIIFYFIKNIINSFQDTILRNKNKISFIFEWIH